VCYNGSDVHDVHEPLAAAPKKKQAPFFNRLLSRFWAFRNKGSKKTRQEDKKEEKSK
jgi:hypothetical protein